MADYQNANLTYMAIEVEGAAGTMETPANEDFNIRLRDIEITPNIEVDDENSKHATGDHGEDISIIGQQSVTINCSTRVVYSSTNATTKPTWWKAAEACGLGAIGWDGGSEVVYGSAADGISLVARKEYDVVPHTIWVYQVNRASTPVHTIWKCEGCMGNMSIGADAIGSPVMANFTFQGALNDIVDGSALDMTGIETTTAEKHLSNTFTIFNNAMCISSWQLDLGNEVSPVYCQSEANGIKYYGITARRPRFTCNPLARKQATDDVLNTTLSQTTGEISQATANYTFKVLKGQLLPPSQSVSEGLYRWDQSYKCLKNGITGTLADAALDPEDTINILHGSDGS